MFPFALTAVRRPQDVVDQPVDPGRITTLAGAATLGVGLYGCAAGAPGGVLSTVRGGVDAVVAAGAAWALALPALVVVSALLGSTVDWRRAVYASLITVNFGGLAFLASVPVVTLLQVVGTPPSSMLLVHLLVIGGVGGCSTVIFDRTMARMEGHRLFHAVWMGVFGTLFLELAWFIDLFGFQA